MTGCLNRWIRCNKAFSFRKKKRWRLERGNSCPVCETLLGLSSVIVVLKTSLITFWNIQTELITFGRKLCYITNSGIYILAQVGHYCVDNQSGTKANLYQEDKCPRTQRVWTLAVRHCTHELFCLRLCFWSLQGESIPHVQMWPVAHNGYGMGCTELRALIERLSIWLDAFRECLCRA